MIEKPEHRSLAEVIMDGDGHYSTLVRVNELGDGTFLVYEKETLFGPWEGFMRVQRLDPNNRELLRGAVISYQSWETEKDVIKKLNDYIMENKQP